MNSTTLLLLLLTISSSKSFSQSAIVKQDTVVKKTGEEVIGKITEVTPTYLVCQITDSLQTINQIILPEDVFMIKYANGTREVIPQTKKNRTPNFSPDEMYAKGEQDALQYYKGNGSMWGTAAATVFYPPLGLVEGIIVGAHKPKVKNWTVPDMNLLSDSNYSAGYQKQAYKKKKRKVLAGFGIGIAPYVIIGAIVVMILQQY